MWKIVVVMLFMVVVMALVTSCRREPEISLEPAEAEVLVIAAMDMRVNFMMRNTSGQVLHYADGFAIYRQEGAEWNAVNLPADSIAHESDVSRYINPNETKQYGLQFSPDFFSLDPGRHKFVRHLFPDPGNRTNVHYVSFEFDVVSWANAATDHRAERERLRHETTSFILEGGDSPRLSIVGYVHVNDFGINFDMQNTSNLNMYGMMHNDLLKYVDGRWQPVPTPPDEEFPMELDIGFPIDAGEIKWATVFFDLAFGTLPPGRYLLVYNYALARPAAIHHGRVHEFMLIEFVIP